MTPPLTASLGCVIPTTRTPRPKPTPPVGTWNRRGANRRAPRDGAGSNRQMIEFCRFMGARRRVLPTYRDVMAAFEGISEATAMRWLADYRAVHGLDRSAR